MNRNSNDVESQYFSAVRYDHNILKLKDLISRDSGCGVALFYVGGQWLPIYAGVRVDILAVPSLSSSNPC